MVDVRTLLAPDLAARVRNLPAGQTVEPQLAATTDAVPTETGWISERKYDGIRLLVYLDDGEVRLRARSGTDRTGTFPELLPAVRRLGATSLVADGEVVAYDGPTTSFHRLQQRLGAPGRPTASASQVPVVLHLFDVLMLDGLDLRGLPLTVRKQLLDALPTPEPLAPSPYRLDDVAAHFATACAEGWEGLILKRADGVYRAGRSSSWRKLKCQRQGRFVVGGWTDPQGQRGGFGALLVGTVAEDGSVRYAGRVGTGFDTATLTTLGRHLRTIAQDTSPFADLRSEPAVHWVVPHLVVEVRFAGWTDHGRLRHPSLVALRPDLEIGAAIGEDAADTPTV